MYLKKKSVYNATELRMFYYKSAITPDEMEVNTFSSIFTDGLRFSIIHGCVCLFWFNSLYIISIISYVGYFVFLEDLEIVEHYFRVPTIKP